MEKVMRFIFAFVLLFAFGGIVNASDRGDSYRDHERHGDCREYPITTPGCPGYREGYDEDGGVIVVPVPGLEGHHDHDGGHEGDGHRGGGDHRGRR